MTDKEEKKKEETCPLKRYDDLMKIFPIKDNFLEEYKLVGDPIGAGGQANVFKAIMK